jgi:hypothetical protein
LYIEHRAEEVSAPILQGQGLATRRHREKRSEEHNMPNPLKGASNISLATAKPTLLEEPPTDDEPAI